MTAPGTTRLGANDLMPCPDARLRHLARMEACATCGVEGSVPENVWRQRADMQHLRLVGRVSA
ncbi:hypothetical protein [Dactylosporangium sp. CA-139066]|uniref:hypothetical protein n=1 Tax=Dactylosporangium sp. CA-139066 TaxID=3239930 RepID=UPI003D916430